MGTLVKICLAVSLIWVLSFAQEPNVVWTQTFGGSNQDDGSCVDQTNDGGFIIVGTTYSFGAGNFDVYLIKTDYLGNMEWYKTYGGTEGDWGYCVRQTTDGGYIIVGSTISFSSNQASDVYLIKTDSLGIEEWHKTFGSPSEYFGDWGVWVEQTTDDGAATSLLGPFGMT